MLLSIIHGMFQQVQRMTNPVICPQSSSLSIFSFFCSCLLQVPTTLVNYSVQTVEKVNVFVLAPLDRRAPLSSRRLSSEWASPIMSSTGAGKLEAESQGLHSPTPTHPNLLPQPLWGNKTQRADLKMEVVQRVIDLNHQTYIWEEREPEDTQMGLFCTRDLADF